MASKARHLRSGVNHNSISVDQLFDAAFGPSPMLYRRESLMGWRRVSSERMTLPDFVADYQPLPRKAVTGNPPGVRIYETPERIMVEVELPKIKADSLYLEISGDLLIIRGERIVKKPGIGQNKKLSTKGPLVHRYVQLPIVARPGEVRARLDGNTVKVNISKRPKSN